MRFPEPPRFIPGTGITPEMLLLQRRRYKALCQKWRTEKFRADIRSILTFTTRRAGAVVDDAQEDHLWCLDHSTRRYRVRPARPGDAAWWVKGIEAVAVFDRLTERRIVVAVAGLLIPISDDDDFGERLFRMRDAAVAGTEQ